jgi:hypothetical protein
VSAVPLGRDRDFILLWSGKVVSLIEGLGARETMLAPAAILLALALVGTASRSVRTAQRPEEIRAAEALDAVDGSDPETHRNPV